MSIKTQSSFNREENKGRKKKERDCPTELIHYSRVHYPNHKFHVLTRVNTIYHCLFISLFNYYFINPFIVRCFAFKLGLDKC
jgi:hypothetical protein